MAVRTTETEVKAILLWDYDSRRSPSLLPFITAASHIVDSMVTWALENDKTVNTDRQQVIEAWLAAHAYTRQDRTFSDKTTDKARATMDGKTGMHLEASMYGQMAMDLDDTGYLMLLNSDASKIPVATGWWAGTQPRDVPSHWDR